MNVSFMLYKLCHVGNNPLYTCVDIDVYYYSYFVIIKFIFTKSYKATHYYLITARPIIINSIELHNFLMCTYIEL